MQQADRVRRVGYHCSHEQHAPSALLRHLRAAEQAGFAEAMCSDHFLPWGESPGQAHAGYAWSWLGAALEASSLTLGTVTAPGYRYHPAVLAQAIATLGEMYPDRLWVALGTGEALNEHITGERWPAKPARRDRLRASVDVMRALLRGERVSVRTAGIDVVDAHLATRPARVPAFVGAALTVETARWCASWADALITVASDQQHAIADAFREAAGAARPVFLQVALTYAPDEAEAEQLARTWAFAAAGDSAFKSDTSTPAAFDAAAARVTTAELRRAIRIATSPAAHVDAIARDLARGIDRVYVHHVGATDAAQERFLAEVAPGLVTL